MSFEAQLAKIEDRYIEINRSLADPELLADYNYMNELAQERSNLTEIVESFRRYRDVRTQLAESRQLLNETDDDDMAELAQMEIDSLSEEEGQLYDAMRKLLLPKDPNDDRDVIVEIRAGTGGDEAGLFAADLFRMYSRWADEHRFKVEVLSESETGLGGLKEVVFAVKGQGQGAYSRLKWESGVHRVQRVPSTESQGRIHTSTATVAVLPEADEVEIEVSMNDVKIDVFRSSGPGGQSVNTTDSAVRLTHLPSGIVISCQDEKSQLQNRIKAMRILRSKLYEMEIQRQQDEMGAARKSQVGTGERSEKIRTYNFPQSRVTDHRINLTLYRLETILGGDLDEFIEELSTRDQAERLQSMGEE